jgi:lipopolysaccharide transport system permease protein
MSQNALSHPWLRYFDIITFRSLASLKAEAQKTYVGYIWWFLEPLINTFMFYLIFSKIIGNRTDNFLVFLLVGTVTWQWLQTTVMLSSQSVIQKAFLLQNVYLPKYIFPAVTVLTNSFKFLFLLVALLVILWGTGHTLSPAYVALPLVMILQFVLVGCLSVLMACCMPYFPDGEIVLETFLRSLMLVSGIFFNHTHIPDNLVNWFYANPMAHLINAYRDILLMGQWPSLLGLGYVLVFDLALILLTVWVFHRVDRQMVKVIAQS